MGVEHVEDAVESPGTGLDIRSLLHNVTPIDRSCVKYNDSGLLRKMIRGVVWHAAWF